MNDKLTDEANERYRGMAEGKKPTPAQTDILWITPKRLGALFGVCLVMTVMLNGIN